LQSEESIGTVTFTDDLIGLMSNQGLREMSYMDWGNAPMTHVSRHARPEYADHDIYFATENTVFYSDFSGTYRREIGNSEFELINNGLSGDAAEIKLIGDYIWAKRSLYYNSGNIYYVSDDAGDTWSMMQDSIFDGGGGVDLLGGYESFVWVKSGTSFIRTDVNTGVSEVVFTDISASGAKGYTAGESFFIVTNNNIRFCHVDGTVTAGSLPVNSARYVWLNDEILAFKDGIRYSSSDFGQTWIEGEYSGNLNGKLYATENGLIACGQSVYRSIDAGLNWVYVNQFHQYASHGNYSIPGHILDFHDGLLVYNHSNRLYFSANEGINKEFMSVPFFNHYSSIVLNYGYVSTQPEGAVGGAFQDGYLILITQEQGIFRTPYAPIIALLPNEVQLNSIVSGRLYKDFDNSCTFNDGDEPLIGKVISIGSGHGITNSVGRYAAGLPPAAATHDYATAPVSNYETICTNTATGTIETGYLSVESLDVAFHPIPGLTDVEIIITSGTIRPGFTANASVKIINKGNEPLTDLTAVLQYDANYLSVITAEGGTETETGEISFPVSLDLNEMITYHLEMQVSETTPLGTEINYIGSVENEGDHTPPDNEYTLTEIVVGSYDPNDKVAFHDEEVLPHTANEILYRIRFQNTGTDTAFTVKVRDTLSQNLDILSFEMVEASHDYDLKIEDPRILEWTFNNILLVDSLTNEPLSHGYIFFRINTTDNLTDGESVSNEAAIYFDFNEPVITNDEVVLIEKGTIYQTDSIALCPGDIYADQVIEQDTMIVQTFWGQIYDTIQTTTVDAFDISEENLTLYGTAGSDIAGMTVWSDTSFTQILETWQGCDSLVTYQFFLNTLELYSELELCEGDEYNGEIVEENFIAIDTSYGEFVDTINITEVTVYPTSITDYSFSISQGAHVLGVQILTDTVLQFNYTTIHGCDSLLIYSLSVITATENIQTTAINAVLSPNPTEGGSSLILLEAQNKEVFISIYDARGQKVTTDILRKNIESNDYKLDLETNNLPAGLYYVYLELEGQVHCLKLVKI